MRKLLLLPILVSIIALAAQSAIAETEAVKVSCPNIRAGNYNFGQETNGWTIEFSPSDTPLTLDQDLVWPDSSQGDTYRYAVQVPNVSSYPQVLTPACNYQSADNQQSIDLFYIGHGAFHCTEPSGGSTDRKLYMFCNTNSFISK